MLLYPFKNTLLCLLLQALVHRARLKSMQKGRKYDCNKTIIRCVHFIRNMPQGAWSKAATSPQLTKQWFLNTRARAMWWLRQKAQLIFWRCISSSMITGSLSPRHGASSGCGWRNGLQLWRVAANILNKQLRTADKGWSSSLGVGRGANNSSP
jgi:hypothetical protein